MDSNEIITTLSFSGHVTSAVTIRIMLAFPATTLSGSRRNKQVLAVRHVKCWEGSRHCAVGSQRMGI